MESDAEAPMEAVVGAGDPDALPVAVKKVRKHKCAVPGCGPTSLKRHKIPNNPLMREAWLDAVGLQGCERKDVRICEAHFVAGDYVSGANQPTLKPEAVPRLRKEDEVESMEEDVGTAVEGDVAAVDVAAVEAAATSTAATSTAATSPSTAVPTSSSMDSSSFRSLGTASGLRVGCFAPET